MDFGCGYNQNRLWIICRDNESGFLMYLDLGCQICNAQKFNFREKNVILKINNDNNNKIK